MSVVPASNIRFHPMVDGYVKAASAAMLAAVGLVLLIACANVASLLLARGNARRRELAIRAAIGAGRGRLIRQLLSEGLVLAVAGGALGTVLASWSGRALGGIAAGVLPIRTNFDFSIDGKVLAFALVVSVATALLFGLAPAWSASKPELVPALKDTGEGEGSGRRRRLTMRDALVVGQLALSLVLLVAGALLTRGLMAARATDIGFDPTHLASLSFNLQMNGYDAGRATAFKDRALQAVRALPGVSAASITSRLPLAPDVNMDGFVIRGHHAPTDDPTPIDTVTVGADYFAAVGVPVVAGRVFTEADVSNGAPGGRDQRSHGAPLLAQRVRRGADDLLRRVRATGHRDHRRGPGSQGAVRWRSPAALRASTVDALQTDRARRAHRRPRRRGLAHAARRHLGARA